MRKLWALTAIGVCCLPWACILAEDAPATRPAKGEPVKPSPAQPELVSQDGADNVRDILLADDGFLVAGAKGVARYRLADGWAELGAAYSSADGMPGDECFTLRRDAQGGIWALCRGGVGYLPRGEARWRAFTDKTGLAPGPTNCIELSGDGSRVWVTSLGGLASASVRDLRWKSWPAASPFKIFTHPTKDIVWCLKQIPSDCSCGCQHLTTQFDLQTEKFHDLPGTQKCPHVAPAPEYYCAGTNRLWLLTGYSPPMVYDLATDKTRTWPREPNWERMAPPNIGVYSDWFGQMLPAWKDGRHLFATNAGLWEYDDSKDEWHIRRWTDDPGCGNPMLVRSLDGNTIYWASDENLAAYDIARDKWALLWHVERDYVEHAPNRLMLSPDGRYVWRLGLGGVLVGNPATRQAVLLTDQQVPGLSGATMVRFDPNHKVALIATPRGVVVADYSGKLALTLQRSACQITGHVEGFVMAPDGSEVWCVRADSGGFVKGTAVYQFRSRQWREVPSAGSGDQFKDVLFSADGKASWLSTYNNQTGHCELLQRTDGNTAWVPIRAKLPEYFGKIARFWLSPGGDELWMYSDGSGLLRLKLASGSVCQYVESAGRRHEIAEIHALAADYVDDLAFTPDGKYALCAAGGGTKHGLTLIDLASGKSSNYEGPGDIRSIKVSADGSTAWCITGNRHLWAFDVRQGKWGIKLNTSNRMNADYVMSLVTSADGRTIWVRSYSGLASYSAADGKWRTLDDAVWCVNAHVAPLVLSGDGNSVICGNRRGMAVVSMDGKSLRILQGRSADETYSLTHIIAVPGSGDFLCAMAGGEDASELYRLDMNARKLRLLARLPLEVTAMAMGPDGLAWVGLEGAVLRIDPATGRREALPAARGVKVVCPATSQPTVSDRITAGTVAVEVGRVAPPATQPTTQPATQPTTQPAALPKAICLGSQGRVMSFPHPLPIANSDSGRVYVIWLVEEKGAFALAGDVPAIPAEWLGMTVAARLPRLCGLYAFDGKAWRKPQLLAEEGHVCNPIFAWCAGEDLNLLAETQSEKVAHLVYRLAAAKWEKLALPKSLAGAPGVRAICEAAGMVHLAGWADERVSYWRFDGKAWSQGMAVARDPNCRNLKIAGGDDGTAHLVWTDEPEMGFDPPREITYAVVKGDKADVHKSRFEDRGVDPSAFALGLDGPGRAMLVYRTVLPEGHPDRDKAHMRRWDGTAWTPPTVIPFGKRGFKNPVLVRRGSKTMLIWGNDGELMSERHDASSYSVLGEGDVWSAPCNAAVGPAGELVDVTGNGIHLDGRGKVHAVWSRKQQLYYVAFGVLGK